MDTNSTLYVIADRVESHGVEQKPGSRIVLIDRDGETTTTANYMSKVSAQRKPLVVEGRTWWYGRECHWQFDTNEFGIRIGKEVELDGQKWYEVRQIKNIMHDWLGNYFNAEDKDVVVGYMHEDGTNVYSRVLIDPTLDLVGSIRDEARAESNLIYSFSDAGFEYGFGDVLKPDITLGIDKLSTEENTGIRYRTWSATERVPNAYQYQYWSEDKPFRYAEGIGVVGKNAYMNMLVYYPFGQSPDGGSGEQPFLRYVTEGKDNTIIYTAAGGPKIWEQTEGVDDIRADRNEETEYFDLYGRKVTHPAPGSMVIRRQGATVTKIFAK